MAQFRAFLIPNPSPETPGTSAGMPILVPSLCRQIRVHGLALCREPDRTRLSDRQNTAPPVSRIICWRTSGIGGPP